MSVTLDVFDETTSGQRHSAGAFQFDIATLTLRELIGVRVQQEVARFNDMEREEFQGLIQPEEPERILNGLRERPRPDWKKQFTKAIKAFNGNGFLVLIDGCQITDLDETLHLTAETEITFLKLVPLVGG
jgi:hypothetical protein